MEKYWKIKGKTSEYVVLTTSCETLKNHILIALILGWWLFFIPNLLYRFTMRQTKVQHRRTWDNFIEPYERSI